MTVCLLRDCQAECDPEIHPHICPEHAAYYTQRCPECGGRLIDLVALREMCGSCYAKLTTKQRRRALARENRQKAMA